MLLSFRAKRSQTVIGIISTLVLISLGSVRAKSRDAKRLSDIRQIANAILLYSEDHNYNYPTPEDSINGWGVMQTQLAPYLAKIPVDPVGGTSGPPNWQYYQFLDCTSSSVSCNTVLGSGTSCGGHAVIVAYNTAGMINYQQCSVPKNPSRSMTIVID